MKEYKGKIISKMERVGTRSEGPEYFLKLDKPNKFGQLELPIIIIKKIYIMARRS